MSAFVSTWRKGPLIDQVRPGLPAAPPPVASEFLSQKHGPITSVFTETDSASRGRHICNITFGSEKRYRVYIGSPDEAERAFKVIVEYLLRFGYDGHVAFFHLVYGGFSKSLEDLKRAIEDEHRRALSRTAEETVAKENGLTVGELRTAISNFKKAATKATAHETPARATAQPRPKWPHDAKPDETPAGFAHRAGYQHRGQIHQEDEALSSKLRNWLRTHKWPDDVAYIPTLPQWNEQQAAKLPELLARVGVDVQEVERLRAVGRRVATSRGERIPAM
jgi:hypothetical protein